MPAAAAGGAVSGAVGGGLSLLGQKMASDANQKSFDQMIGFMKGRTKKELGLIDQWSGQNVLDAQRDWNNQLGGLAQSQISRGVTGSTIASSEQLAGMRTANAGIQDAKDQYLKLKLAAYGATTGDTSKVWSGWQSPQPNYNAFSQIGQGVGMGVGALLGNPYSGGRSTGDFAGEANH